MGLFINRYYPYFEASPDDIFQDCLVEYKCIYVLRDSKPSDFTNLTPAQKNGLCFNLTSNGDMKIKRTHQYYFQVQMAMFVTGNQPQFAEKILNWIDSSFN